MSLNVMRLSDGGQLDSSEGQGAVTSSVGSMGHRVCSGRRMNQHRMCSRLQTDVCFLQQILANGILSHAWSSRQRHFPAPALSFVFLLFQTVTSLMDFVSPVALWPLETSTLTQVFIIVYLDYCNNTLTSIPVSRAYFSQFKLCFAIKFILQAQIWSMNSPA